MAGNLITSLLSHLSLATDLLPSIEASAQALSSTSSNSNNSLKERAQGVQDNIKSLMVTLEGIKATSRAAHIEIPNSYVRHWLQKIGEVACNAKDLLRKYQNEITSVQVEASGPHKREQMEDIVPIPNGMVDPLNEIRTQFEEFAKDSEALKLIRESDEVRHRKNKLVPPPTGQMVDEVSMSVRDAEKEACLTTTSEGNKDEKLLYILIGLITLLATAVGIAAIPVPENSRKKTLVKICSGLFDILVLIFLGAMMILGIYIHISKATVMKHISISFVVFFIILVACSILKMLMVAAGDL